MIAWEKRTGASSRQRRSWSPGGRRIAIGLDVPKKMPDEIEMHRAQRPSRTQLGHWATLTADTPRACQRFSSVAAEGTPLERKG